jgi:hypothetical protein
VGLGVGVRLGVGVAVGLGEGLDVGLALADVLGEGDVVAEALAGDDDESGGCAPDDAPEHAETMREASMVTMPQVAAASFARHPAPAMVARPFIEPPGRLETGPRKRRGP